jgi:DNA polymerase phi
MSTTLPLFWDLSAAAKQKRLKASSELITALERFQLGFEAGQPSSAGGDADMADDDAGSDDDESGEEVDESEDEDDEETNEVDLKEAKRLDKALDRQNSEDVRYSIRRLVRGLASSRESSRLGFAVALTEVRSFLCSKAVC